MSFVQIDGQKFFSYLLMSSCLLASKVHVIALCIWQSRDRLPSRKTLPILISFWLE